MLRKQISILGCGWLGYPLAKAFISNGFHVKGTTTTKEKLPMLEVAHIDAFHIQVIEKQVIGSFENFLSESDFLIINVPPKRSLGQINYAKKLKNIVPFLEKSNVKHVLFVSSTSVYDYNIDLITEETTLMAKVAHAQDMLAVEQLFLNLEKIKCYILRFGGLINEERQPVRFLVKKSLVENPDHAVNLIHLDDCIALIMRIVEKSEKLNKSEIFIGVNQQHQTRKIYYTKKAQSLGLSLPHFSEINDSLDKKIDNPRTREILHFNFSYPL